MKRCSWSEVDEVMMKYHDEEWGFPLRADSDYLERLTLEVFQAGLNWRMILHKRRAFRRAFERFSIERIASFGERDVTRLLNDPEIVRNRKKIEATVENAKVFQEIRRDHGSFKRYLSTLDSFDEEALHRELKRRFHFMGTSISESFLQSVGRLPTWHEARCWRAKRS